MKSKPFFMRRKSSKEIAIEKHEKFQYYIFLMMKEYNLEIPENMKLIGGNVNPFSAVFINPEMCEMKCFNKTGEIRNEKEH